MTILLVRHAAALRRADWTRPDHLRPLTPRGYAQAEALVGHLGDFDIGRVLTSASTRCVETIEPLAGKRALPIEDVEELAEGAGAAAVRLLPELGGSTAVLCTHGDVIPDLLAALAPETLRNGAEWAKASTWVIDPDSETARYLAPPDAGL